VGELKDGKPFKGTAMVTITEWKAAHGRKWDHPAWLNADRDIDHWWNQEEDIEDWWEKIRNHPEPKPEPGLKGQRR
jgi:hypothetical protein